MAKAEPWLRKGRGWYVTINGRQRKLAGVGEREQAYEKWHRMMVRHGNVAPEDLPLGYLIQEFLDHVKKNREPATDSWYRRYMNSLLNAGVGVSATTRVGDLRRLHITRWVGKRYAQASNNTKSCAMRAVFTMLNWCVSEQHIERNPLAGMKAPRYEPREVEVSPEDWQRIIGSVREDDPFRDYLLFLRHTGCRPQEARWMESRHFQPEDGMIVFPVHQSKGKRHKRVILLDEVALGIVRRGVLRHPEGPVLRNGNGEPWTNRAVSSRFSRLRKKLKIDGLCAYAIRHTFCTEALRATAGNTYAVAKLMGHVDTKMVEGVYSHLKANDPIVRAALEAHQKRLQGGDGALEAAG